MSSLDFQTPDGQLPQMEAVTLQYTAPETTGKGPYPPTRPVLRIHQEAQSKPSRQRSPDGTHNHDGKGVTHQLTPTISQPFITCTETPLVNAIYVFPDTEPSHFQKIRGRWKLQNCLLKSQVGHKNKKRIKSHNVCTNTLLFSLKTSSSSNHSGGALTSIQSLQSPVVQSDAHPCLNSQWIVSFTL